MAPSPKSRDQPTKAKKNNVLAFKPKQKFAPSFVVPYRQALAA